MKKDGDNINKLEICVTSVESALAAQEGGAQRIELCDNLWEGGTTPSAGMISQIKQLTDIDLFVLIRPRGGDFLYSNHEFEVMKSDIEMARAQSVDGIVSGAILPDGTVDKSRTIELVKLSGPLPFTFHRAFDCVSDAIMAIETLIECGVTRVLSSGLQQTAEQGALLLRELQTVYGDKIIIMPGGGITSENVLTLATKTNCKEWHMTAKTWQESHMTFDNDELRLNGSRDIPENKLMVASIDEIKRVTNILCNSSAL